MIFIFNIHVLTNNTVQLHASAPKFGIVCHSKHANCQKSNLKRKFKKLFAIFHAADTYVEATTLLLKMAKCDLSRENVQQRFPVEQLKPLGTRWVPVGGVDESVEGVGKAVGFFSLPVEGVEKSR